MGLGVWGDTVNSEQAVSQWGFLTNTAQRPPAQTSFWDPPKIRSVGAVQAVWAVAGQPLSWKPPETCLTQEGFQAAGHSHLRLKQSLV